jgi:hypothetical protein
MMNLVEKVSRRLREGQLMQAARAVLDTAPIRARRDGVVIASMIGTRVLLPYLVAVKSLDARLGRGRIVILDDGTLTAADKALLAHHCDNPQVIPIASVETAPAPRGGCWERLLAILDIAREDYVIQLDSDIVTVGPVPEVAAAIEAGRSFTLLGGEDSMLSDPAQVVAFAKERAALLASMGETKVHLQLAIELAMDQVAVPGLAAPRYVRGCAGFAGFAPDAAGRAPALAFSAEAERLVGSRWSEWGSEQVASNFVIANRSDPVMLPYARYLNYWCEAVPADAALVHFLGTNRYHAGRYAAAAKAAIAGLPTA